MLAIETPHSSMANSRRIIDTRIPVSDMQSLLYHPHASPSPTGGEYIILGRELDVKFVSIPLYSTAKKK